MVRAMIHSLEVVKFSFSPYRTLKLTKLFATNTKLNWKNTKLIKSRIDAGFER